MVRHRAVELGARRRPALDQPRLVIAGGAQPRAGRQRACRARQAREQGAEGTCRRGGQIEPGPIGGARQHVHVRVGERRQQQRLVIADRIVAGRRATRRQRRHVDDAPASDGELDRGRGDESSSRVGTQRPTDDARRAQSDDGRGFASFSFISAPQHMMLPAPALLHSASVAQLSQM
jgi:hypothetical protein